VFLAGPEDQDVTEQQVVDIPAVTRQRLREWVIGWFTTMADALREDGTLEKKVGRFAAWKAHLDEQCRMLYGELVQPVHERIRKLYPGIRRLVILPSQGLTLLPLHAAWREEDRQRRYWTDDYEITFAPSAQVLARCLERERQQPGPAGTLLALQNPDESLPFTDWEVESVAGHFTKEHCQILKHAEATEHAVREQLHFGEEKLFSTHGLSNPVRIEESHLVLRRGGKLAFPEILAGRWSAWLTVLSACQTGITNLQDLADEYEGLPAAFLLSGSQTVVASLWSVSDCSTALVMRRFHENLYTNHMDKAAALQEAQHWLRTRTYAEIDAMLEGKRRELFQRMAATDIVHAALNLPEEEHPFAHPYYWAAFQCIGAGGRAR